MVDAFLFFGLGVISLTTPALLALGAAGASLPIAAHLLNRRARRRIIFPTVQYLLASTASQSSFFKMRRWLLLLLRVLAVLLIAAAFARPVWTDPAADAAGPGQGAAVVLVVDASASTAQRGAGASAMATIRAASQRVLGDLQPGRDRVNLVVAESRPRSIFPQMTANIDALAAELDQLKPTYDRADLPAAIAAAGQWLAGHDGPRRVVILSDMQQTNWADLASPQAPAFAKLPRGARVTIIPAQTGQSANAGLAAPRVIPPQPTVGEPAQLVVSIINAASEPRSVHVNVTVDGAPLDGRAIRLAPYETKEAAFAVRFAQPGQRRVTFNIGRDGLEADNQAHLIADVARQTPIAIVSDENPLDPRSGVYFLERALAPRGDDRDPMAVRLLTSADLATESLSRFRAVFCLRMNGLTQQGAAALAAYLRQGGGAAVFLGRGPVRENLLSLQAAGQRLAADVDAASGDAATAVLPMEPISPRDLSFRQPGAERLMITQGAWGAPLLRDFDAQSQQALSQVHFRRIWSASALAPSAASLLTFSDRTPAMASVGVGAGRLTLVNFSPDADSSDLGAHGAFVALAQTLAAYLQAGAVDQDPAIVGQTATFTSPATAEAVSRGPTQPDGAASNQSAAGAASLAVLGPDNREHEANITPSATGELTITLPRPTLPGIYRAVAGDQTRALVAVNIDARESDLRAIDSANLAGDPANADNAAAADPSDPQPGQQPDVSIEFRHQADQADVLNLHGQPLWHVCIALAMLMLAVEMLLLRVWRR